MIRRIICSNCFRKALDKNSPFLYIANVTMNVVQPIVIGDNDIATSYECPNCHNVITVYKTIKEENV